MLDEKVKELLRKLLKTASENNIQFAIGGGIAVNIYNIPRFTSDVDAYFKQENRIEILRHLTRAGFEVSKVFSPHHYIAFLPKHKDPRFRIDILFPEDEPEISAIEKPAIIKKWNMKIPVFPVELLVLSKFYSNQPLDKWDIASLYLMGSFEPATVKYLLSTIDPDQTEEFDKLMAEIKKEPGISKKRPKRRKE
jgi:hypothetical protein